MWKKSLLVALALTLPALADEGGANNSNKTNNVDSSNNNENSNNSETSQSPGSKKNSSEASEARAKRESTQGECGPDEKDRPSWAPIPTCDAQVLWGMALQAHGLFVPGFLLAPFLQQYTNLNSGGFALQGIRRKGTLDIVMTLDFSLYTPADGNWIGAGKDPSLDTHYVQFHGLNFMSLDIAFIYTHDLASWIAIQVGGGVGLGYVFGEIDAINNSNVYTNAQGQMVSVCTAANSSDTSKCFPHSSVTYMNGQGQMVPVGDIKPSDPDFQAKLNATQTAQNACLSAQAKGQTGLDCRDTAQHPYFHATTDKPPVLPVINFIVGFKFKLHRHFNFNVSGGFRDGFVLNGGPEYVF